MPLLLPLPVVIVGIFCAMLAAATVVWSRPIAEWMGDNIPVIGGRIRARIVQFSDYIEAQIERFAGGARDAVVDGLNGLTHAAQEFGEQFVLLGDELVERLQALATVTVPAKIRAALVPVNAAVRAARVLADEAHDIGVTLRDRTVPAVRTEARQAAAALDRRLDAIVDTTIPQLGRALGQRIDRVVARIDGAVIPRLRDLELELPRLRDAQSALRRGLDEVREHAGAIAAIGGAAVALRLLRRVLRCESKLEKACTLDMDEWDDILGLAFTAVGIGSMLEIVRAGVAMEDAIADEIRAVLADEG